MSSPANPPISNLELCSQYGAFDREGRIKLDRSHDLNGAVGRWFFASHSSPSIPWTSTTSPRDPEDSSAQTANPRPRPAHTVQHARCGTSLRSEKHA